MPSILLRGIATPPPFLCRRPYAAELRTLLLLVCIAPGLGITASTSIYQHATKPLVDAVAPTVVPRVLRLKRSSQKAAVAALQPMLTMATESLLPYAAPEGVWCRIVPLSSQHADTPPPPLSSDLDRAQEAMERLRAQVTKRRRELEIRGLARPLMGSPTASVLGQAAANVMESVQGAVQADDQAPPPSSDRSSMEAAAQGAWSMVSGLVRMLPAAQGATSPRHSSAAGTVTSAASGGSGASGVVSEDAQGTWEAGLEDMDAVLDDDQVPLAFVDEDSSPPPARGRHTMAGPGAARGQRQPRTRASDGYTMRKRSGGTRGAMH